MSPVIQKKHTIYRFNPEGKYRESILQCDTYEEFEHALLSLKSAGGLPQSTDIDNIMSLVKAKDENSTKWDLRLDNKMQNEKNYNPQIVAAIIAAAAVVIAALIAALL